MTDITTSDLASELAVVEHVLDMIERGQSLDFIKATLERRATELYRTLDSIDRESAPELYEN